MKPSLQNEYRSPPLVEAVFEIFLDGALPTSWSEDSFSDAQKLFPEFTFHEESLEDYAFMVRVAPNNSVSQAMSRAPRRLRWWDEPRQRAIQFSSHMCAYNVLVEAYGHFEDHLETLRRILGFFIAEARPKSIPWVGQRYLNSIKIPQEESDVASYFAIYPRLPEEIGEGHIQFTLQLQTAVFEQGDVQVGFYPGKPNSEGDAIPYILDVSARSVGNIEPDANQILSWQQNAHEHVNRAFELCVSDRSRKEIFGLE